MQSTGAFPNAESVTDCGRSPYRTPLPDSFINGTGISGRSTARSIRTTGSPVIGSLRRFPLSISASSRYVCEARRITTSVCVERSRRIHKSVRTIRGRHSVANADNSAARIGTVPISVPSA